MEQLKSILPECRERSLTYDMNEADIHPQPGQFLVSICKGRKPGSCYQVVSCKKVNSIVNNNRYKLKVFSCPDMLPYTKIFGFRFNVTVKDERAFPLFWYSRNRKKKN